LAISCDVWIEPVLNAAAILSNCWASRSASSAMRCS
jgi:hypothetical protein